MANPLKKILNKFYMRGQKSAEAEISAMNIYQMKAYARKKNVANETFTHLWATSLLGAVAAIGLTFSTKLNLSAGISWTVGLSGISIFVLSFIPMGIARGKLDAVLERLKAKGVSYQFIKEANGPRILEFGQSPEEIQALQQKAEEERQLQEKKAAEDFDAAVQASIKLKDPLPYKGPIKVRKLQ